MTVADAVVQAAEYVHHEGSGPCLRVVTSPVLAKPRGTVVWAHAFGEEMNKTRRMCARAARAMAAHGWRVVQRDLSGCGDSAGEFRDAEWAHWLAELLCEADPVPRGELWYWGVRAGALLAAQLATERPDANLLLWQPVTSGAQHLQQFLRLHAGARIVGAGGGVDPSPAQALRSGTTVELGGYELGASLAGSLEKATLQLPDSFGGRVVWLEVVQDDPVVPSPAHVRVVERLAATGTSVEHVALNGPPFWQTQEIEDCASLLEHSLERLDAPVSRMHA